MSSLRTLGIPLSLLFALATGGCAKIADPHPPFIPAAGSGLEARQVAGTVVLAMPQPDTEGLKRLELLRIVESADKTPSPLSPDAFLEEAEQILSIPASKFPSYLKDKRFVMQDKLQLGGDADVYAHVFRYAVRLANKRNQAAGLSNQVLIRPVPIPPAPSKLSFEASQDEIRIRWPEPSPAARIAGYNIFRSEKPGSSPADPVNQTLLTSPEYSDRNFEFDKTYYYRVTVVASLQAPHAEGLPSEEFPFTPRDTFPPAPPGDFTALLQGDTVTLLWSPSASPDVAGYRIYRRQEGAEKQLLQKEIITGLSFRDLVGFGDSRYEYFIVAVDTHGNISREVAAFAESVP